MDRSKLLDAMATSLSQTPANEYTNLLCEQSYIFDTFFGDLKPREMTGKSVLFNAIITGDSGDTNVDATETGFGAYDGSYDEIPIGATEYMTQGEVNWTAYIGHWAISEMELVINSGKEAFIDVGKSKIEGAMTRLANIIESQFWSASAYLHVSDDAPWILGPEYWVTDDGYAINDSGGTNGTTVASIDPTDSDFNDAQSRNRWRNQAKEIASANELLDGLDDLGVDCSFKAPPKVQVNTPPGKEKWRLVLNKNGYKSFQRLMRRLGEPLSASDPRWNNVKVEWADRMAARSDSTNQGFLFNMKTWRARVAKGFKWRRDPVFTPNKQPSVRAQYFKFWPALWCEDRRSNGKIYGFGNELVEA